MEKKSKQPCPYEKASWISKVSFWWLNPIFKTGFKRTLTSDDLYDVLPEDRSDVLADRLEKAWERALQRKEKSVNMWWIVLMTFKWEWIKPGIYLLISEILRVSQPFLIGKLIQYFQPDSLLSEKEVYIYAVLLGMTGLGLLAFQPLYFFTMHKVAMQMKAAVGAVVFRKIMRISSQSLHQTTSGHVVNLLSTDVENFNYTTETFHFIWVAPIETVVVLYLIYQNVGMATILTLIVIFSLIPLQFYLGSLFGRLRLKIGHWSDQRIHAMNEIISGIKVIKMYCWEKPFSDFVAKLRRREMTHLWKAALAKSFNIELYLVSSRILSILVFVGAWQFGALLSTKSMFSAFGWLETLRVTTFFYLFCAVEANSMMHSSMKRIQKFMLLEEMKTCGGEPEKGSLGNLVDSHTKFAVIMVNMTACWDKYEVPNSELKIAAEEEKLLKMDMSGSFYLKNISLDISKGELMIVIGTVGSGKSSLLLNILGELHPAEGTVKVNGTVGYVSQQPWVFSGTVRDNILFGQEYDPDRYKQVLFDCGLNMDMDNLPSADLTLVGERGLMLSGGQKSRVTLARSIYRRNDIYILDDPLSAVDNSVGRHIFDRCICDFLKDKTRILVTHQLQYLSKADRIIIMKEGCVVDVGTYEELTSRTEFSKWVSVETDGETGAQAAVSAKRQTNRLDSMVVGEEVQVDEEKAEGKVDARVYKEYIRAGKAALSIPLCISAVVASYVCLLIADWFLARWGENSDIKAHSRSHLSLNISNNSVCDGCSSYTSLMYVQTTALFITTEASTVPIEHRPDDEYIYLFIIMSLGFILFTVIAGTFFYSFCMVANTFLHNKMFRFVVGAKSHFFDINPLGRILNRFSRDIGFMDDMIPRFFYAIVDIAVHLIAMLVMICLINPWLLIPLLPLVAFVYLVRDYAVKTTRETKRIEATARSPVYSHVSDTMAGLQTIRALTMTKQFVKDFDNLQDSHTCTWFHHLSACNWLQRRTSFAVVIYLNFIIHLSLILKNVMNITSGLFALALTYCIIFLDPFELLVRLSAEFENHMTSVERVLSYTDLEQEIEFTSDTPPPDDWPKSGSLKLDDVCLKYTDQGSLVLKHISCMIRDKQKIGIVGRTGAGKSSLMSAIFRLAEPSGIISIDGVNVLKVGLHELRKKISVIPQDPVLFSGTLRRNLDPFNQHTDDQLWEVLAQVQLRDKVVGMDGKLYMEMSESGQNFSVGQRQLVCLARAILRYNKILIIDEATANVDHKTDSLIQQTIREHFHDCTVLTIAHRLHTVIDSDYIMVLDNGELKEFDIPHKLLQDEHGVFTKLVKLTGPTQEAELRSLASKCSSRLKIVDC